MIDAYVIHDDLKKMDETLDDLANPAYTLSKQVLGEDFVALTGELIKECY